jgi:hypothetical protein
MWMDPHDCPPVHESNTSANARNARNAMQRNSEVKMCKDLPSKSDASGK